VSNTVIHPPFALTGLFPVSGVKADSPSDGDVGLTLAKQRVFLLFLLIVILYYSSIHRIRGDSVIARDRLTSVCPIGMS